MRDFFLMIVDYAVAERRSNVRMLETAKCKGKFSDVNAGFFSVCRKGPADVRSNQFLSLRLSFEIPGKE
jgi:hypothetical protein